jgi:hypothetical protein
MVDAQIAFAFSSEGLAWTVWIFDQIVQPFVQTYIGWRKGGLPFGLHLVGLVKNSS